MFRSALSLCGKLVIVLGLILGGLGPVRANASQSDTNLSAMAMMPGMVMQHGTPGQMPHKPMPCCGDDGCCIAGSCALLSGAIESSQIALKAHSSETPFKPAFRDGVTFAPSLRPPIQA